MKRLWFIVIALGLISVFSMQALAVDVKFSGEFYAAGLYQDKTSLQKDVGPSTAFYFQRLRLKTEFVVSPGLSFITRADIMERAWGAARTASGTTLDTGSAATMAENENIGFDLAYIQYVSPIGIITAGYQLDGTWGTVFLNSESPVGKVTYTLVTPVGSGSLILGGDTGKSIENSYTAKKTSATWADRDSSFYSIYGIYKVKNGEAGVYARYMRDATARSTYLTDGVIVMPYLKAQIGPIFLQAEVDYLWGTIKMENNIPYKDIDIRQLAGWVDATANLGMFYLGGTVIYVPGDDKGTSEKQEGGLLSGGRELNPCLIMFNSDLSYWAGSISGYDSTGMTGPMTNAWFFQGRGGVKPIDKLDIMASVSYAVIDKAPADVWEGRKYGWEVDVTGTYKITTNLSYMLGAGYWFAGNYFYGSTSSRRDLNNDFLIINKLTLTF